MAVQLPDNWLSQLLDACVAEPLKLRRVDGKGHRASARWLRHHLHASGLAYGLPSVRPSLLKNLDDESRLAHAHLLATAAHLLDVIRGTAQFVQPALAPGQLRPRIVAVLAIWLDKDAAANTALVDVKATEKRKAREEVELGKGLRGKLDELSAPAIGLALHGGLLTSEARALARITRRLLQYGVPSSKRAKLLRKAAAAERLLLVRTGIALQIQLKWSRGWRESAIRKQLTNAGVEKSPLKTLLARTEDGPVLVEERGYFLALAVTQLLLGGLAEQRFQPHGRDHMGALWTATGLSMTRLCRLQRRAERIVSDVTHHVAMPVHVEGAKADAMAGQIAQWTQRAVLQNLDAVVNEIRETGELAQLLARAGAGQQLTPAEWQKVREQLLDVVKAVPSLAVFALPGGALLLPLLLKVLPFDIRPSSFRPKNPTPPRGVPALPPPNEHP